jgi:hypothetical protein
MLVGLTPLMLTSLEGRLSAEAEVSAVPFPGVAFDRAVVDIQPRLVVIDVTYLDEGRVRPVMIDRFRQFGSVLVFVSEAGGGWVDDLGTGRSGYIEDASPAGLLALLSPPALSVVPA